MSKLSDSQKGFVYLYVFRKQMESKLLKEVVNTCWSDEGIARAEAFIKSSDEVMTNSSLYENRFSKFDEIVSFASNQLSVNRFFEKVGIVKFVGISGSVAANIYKDGDDIDLFVVVADNWSWIYRGIIKILLTLKGQVARNYNSREVSKTLCLNLIVEERGIKHPESVFFMHEVLHVVPLYNPQYLDKIIWKNSWFSALVDKIPLYKEPAVSFSFSQLFNLFNLLLSPILILVNNLAFLLQMLFMILMNHKPELSRLIKNHLRGKIAFYPENFRREKEKIYEEMCKEYFRG